MRTERRATQLSGLACILIATSWVACDNPSPEGANLLRLDFDRSDPRSFISYYFGGLAQPDASDPFASGLVTESEGGYYVDLQALTAMIDPLDPPEDANRDGTLDWDELEPFFQRTYYDLRRMPQSIDSVLVAHGSEDWFEVSVDGVMTSARRQITVPLAALRSALSSHRERGNRLVYPEGTLIVAEHVEGGRIAEHTVMRKRADGHWDYAVYDSTGNRVSSTQTQPKPLAVPTQCVGCHLGSRLYEPEKSFPAPSPPGPSGPRAVHWGGPMPSTELVRHFDEHRRRSDGILGLYGTLYVAELEARRRSGTLSEEEAQLLQSLDL